MPLRQTYAIRLKTIPKTERKTEKEKRHEKGEKIVGSGAVSADGV